MMIELNQNVESLEVSPSFSPVSKVVLIKGTDGNGIEQIVEAGTDTGYTLKINCPWATQTMANNILATAKGFVYTPYSAKNALIDPAAELGDAVYVGGVTSVVYTMETTFDALYTADISAPQEEEIDHEYPYKPNENREIARKTATITTELRIGMDNITSSVAYSGTWDEEDYEIDYYGFAPPDDSEYPPASNLNKYYLDKTTGYLYQSNYVRWVHVKTLTSLQSSFSSQIQQTAESITSTVDGNVWDTSPYTIDIYDDGTPSAAGYSPVTYDGKYYLNRNTGSMFLAEDGQWKSKGQAVGVKSLSSIKQNSDKITWVVAAGGTSSSFDITPQMADIISERIDLYGTVTFHDLQTNDGTTIINGSNITTGTINARVGKMYSSDSTTNYYLELDNKGIAYLGQRAPVPDWWLKTSSNNVSLGSTYGTIILSAINGVAIGSEHLYPSSDGIQDCGKSTNRWNNIYATTSTISTSDREKKTDINYSGLSGYDHFFDGLRPVTYRFKDGVRTHFGMISQDIEELIDACDLDSNDVAAFIKSPICDEDDEETITGYNYALRYEEFVPLLIKQVQDLKARIKALEEK